MTHTARNDTAQNDTVQNDTGLPSTANLKTFSFSNRWLQRWTGTATTVDEALRLADGEGFCLKRLQLGRMDLRGLDLSDLTLCGSDFTGADLREVNFKGSDLNGCDFAGADLRDARLCGSQLSQTSFFGADLRGADVTGADLEGAWLDFAEVAGAQVSVAQLQRTAVMALKVDLFTAFIRRPGLNTRLHAALLGGTFGGDLLGKPHSRQTLSAAELVPNEPRLPRPGEWAVRGRLQTRTPRIGRMQAWLSGVRPGTPANDPAVALTLAWCRDWAARRQGAGIQKAGRQETTPD